MLLADFTYELPDEKIARYPVSPRDTSRLLVYKEGAIKHSVFNCIVDELPADTLLVFNDTKVIPARVHFQRTTGAYIEVLLLNPELPTRIVNDAMLVTNNTTWKCMIGNKKKWKSGEILKTELDIDGTNVLLEASLVDYESNLVSFKWTNEISFLKIVQKMGDIPLPPYLGRDAELSDITQYQTVYASNDGAVAAPTAGLHFTAEVLKSLENKGVTTGFVTLHVGAGTFQPVKAEAITDHRMHEEQIVFERAFIATLLSKIDHVVAVGTTSMRSLESLYWYGVKLIEQGADASFTISQGFAYNEREYIPSAKESLEAILRVMDAKGKPLITGETSIYIYPSYEFKIVSGLVTNYHQPGSTLIMLVAAFVGEEWQMIYKEALASNYRFLSFGDSSLLWRKIQ